MKYSLETKFEKTEFKMLLENLPQHAMEHKLIESFSEMLIKNLIEKNGMIVKQEEIENKEGETNAIRFSINFHLYTESENKKLMEFAKVKLNGDDFNEFKNLLNNKL